MKRCTMNLGCTTAVKTFQYFEIVQAAPAQFTWYHNCTLLDKVKDAGERQFFIAQTIQNGWSRDVLVHQIESGFYFANTQTSEPESTASENIAHTNTNLDTSPTKSQRRS